MADADDKRKGQTITVTQAAALLSRTPRWVQNLVAAGFIKKSERGSYSVVEVVRGAVAYYEDQIEKASKSAAASRATDARTREIELRIAEKRRDLIPREDAEQALEIVVGEVNKQFTGLPARITRDLGLRREIEAKLNDAKGKIADALASGRVLAETGRDPTDPDSSDAPG